MSRPTWLDVLIFGILLAVIIVSNEVQSNRINDLEQRVTTFETIRIEMVAPPEGVSP